MSDDLNFVLQARREKLARLAERLREAPDVWAGRKALIGYKPSGAFRIAPGDPLDSVGPIGATPPRGEGKPPF